ncbi:cytoskeletal protein binding protein, partial [Ceratobasidium sp. 428]
AKPISLANTIYDFTASDDGELSITEDELLSVYEQEAEWWLVKSREPGGKAGYVPASYVELAGPEGKDNAVVVAPARTVPASTPRSLYSHPTNLVTASHAQARHNPVLTWSRVFILDEKGKKKRDKKKPGTLGVGNGAIFFASDLDKVNYSALPRDVI